MIAIGSSDNLICSSIVWLLLRNALHHSSRGTSIVSLHFTPPVNKAGRVAVPAADHGLAAANTFRTWSNYDKPLASWQRLAYVLLVKVKVKRTANNMAPCHVTQHVSAVLVHICALCSVGKIKCKSSNTLLIYWWHFALNPSQIENINGANDWHQW